MRRLLVVAGTIAGLTYYFDPERGSARRAQTKDRAGAMFRRLVRRSEHVGRGVANQASSLKQQAAHRSDDPKDLDDVTLARKVETEIFRDADAPKGQVNVEVVEAVVTLRGQVDSPDLIEELEKSTRKVTGVRDVENLLHTPDQPAPNAPGS
jgi:osmotically-inducible protein OsmY